MIPWGEEGFCLVLDPSNALNQTLSLGETMITKRVLHDVFFLLKMITLLPRVCRCVAGSHRWSQLQPALWDSCWGFVIFVLLLFSQSGFQSLNLGQPPAHSVAQLTRNTASSLRLRSSGTVGLFCHLQQVYYLFPGLQNVEPWARSLPMPAWFLWARPVVSITP